LLFGITNIQVDDCNALAKGDVRGLPISEPMSKHCGFENTQQ